MSVDEQIEKMMEKLNSLCDEYAELNKKTKGKYNYRQNSIELQISVLQAIKEGHSAPFEDWDRCLSEDKWESGIK